MANKVASLELAALAVNVKVDPFFHLTVVVDAFATKGIMKTSSDVPAVTVTEPVNELLVVFVPVELPNLVRVPPLFL